MKLHQYLNIALVLYCVGIIFQSLKMMDILVAAVKLVHLMNWTTISCVYDDTDSFGEYYLDIVSNYLFDLKSFPIMNYY